ncbi:uncharacterized protein LY79DRAFT_6190 [Colletotrichum navitas]|uniref:Uncharacterized protein n=1 Tax=Colletotrichum navitas TaxID=681940 RepID=A0AAD8QCL0_9PEZI|nr:uncharacterized protein LY79DRAFT_6190 [Colletotrichum navitas]KAK1600091.1 hypothetical protein LY79DRAFT_6190 [Colletotrichum navitas]
MLCKHRSIRHIRDRECLEDDERAKEASPTSAICYGTHYWPIENLLARPPIPCIGFRFVAYGYKKRPHLTILTYYGTLLLNSTASSHNVARHSFDSVRQYNKKVQENRRCNTWRHPRRSYINHMLRSEGLTVGCFEFIIGCTSTTRPGHWKLFGFDF